MILTPVDNGVKKMKTRTILGLTIVLSLLAVPAMADFTVEIGTPASEAGFALVGWGPVEPSTSGGSYGSIATDPASLDGFCRVIWAGTEPDTPEGRSASLTFPTAVSSVTIRHLLGIAEDSFDLRVYGAGQLWGSVSDTPGGTETWVESTFSGTPGTTITLTATGPAWSGFATYGQVAIDRIEAVAVPVPGAVLLGFLGLSYAGVKLRKHA